MTDPQVHLTGEELARYRARGLSPGELLRADDHLALCEQCYARLGQAVNLDDQATKTFRAFQALYAEPTHLGYEQLEACAEGKLGEIDLEIAESHLESCAQCAAELADLREVVSRGVSRDFTGTPVRRRSWFAGIARFFQQSGPRLAFQVSLVLAAVALAVILATIPYRSETARLRARVTELERTNEELKTQATTLEPQIAELRAENEALKQRNGGETAISITDGGARVSVDLAGNLVGLETTPHYQQMAKDALVSGRIKLPAGLAELRSKSGTLMGSNGTSFKLVEPVGVVIESDRPKFRWTALDGASGYTVGVYDSAMNSVAKSDSLKVTEWTARVALKRGEVYIWQVRATKDGRETVAPPPAAGRAKFKVLEQSRHQAIENARRSQTRSHLLMGLMYADAGMLGEARQQFDVLLHANPDSSIVRKLVQSLKAAK
jgi:hypothetical protein